VGGHAVTVEFGRGGFERVSSAEAPSAVTDVDVRTGRGAKTFVTFTVADDAVAGDVAVDILERLAAARERVSS
jgi:hypothetical protein